MITTNIARQYWHLFRWLMIPARYHYWLFMLSVVVTIVAIFCTLIGSLLNAGDWRLVFFGIWAIVFALWSFNAVLVLHGQLLSLPSNRQLRLIPGVRQRALVIHWVVLTIMAMLFTACQYFLKGMEFTLGGLILNWALFSFASVIFLLCLRWLASFSLLGVWFFGMGFSAFIWPLDISPWLLFALAVVIWLGFSFWWLHWLPTGKVENIFLLRNWQSSQCASFCHWTRFPINMIAPRIKFNYTPVSLYSHLLNGVTGNVVSRVITWLLIGGFAVLGLSLMVLLGYGWALRDASHVAIPIALWTFLGSAGMGFFAGFYARISRVWLYFPGTRAELFNAIEKNFVLLLIVDLFFICALIGFACYWVFPEYLLIKWIALYCLLVLAINWALFHFVWYLYCRTQGSNNVFGIAIFFIVVAQIVLAGIGWGAASSGSISAELLVLGAIFCCLLGALSLRASAQKATPKMCFARGKA